MEYFLLLKIVKHVNSCQFKNKTKNKAAILTNKMHSGFLFTSLKYIVMSNNFVWLVEFIIIEIIIHNYVVCMLVGHIFFERKYVNVGKSTNKKYNVFFKTYTANIFVIKIKHPQLIHAKFICIEVISRTWPRFHLLIDVSMFRRTFFTRWF